MTTTTLDMKVHDFLAQKRIAVAGVSRDKSDHPVGNFIYHRLKTTGHEVFAVNPHMQTFEGARLQRGERPTRVDASVDGEGHECVVRGRRVLPSTRHQCDRLGVPDDVRRGR